MKVRIWCYRSKHNVKDKYDPCNLAGETLDDLTLEPYGEYTTLARFIAPQLSLTIGVNTTELVFASNNYALRPLPVGTLMTVRRNGHEIKPPDNDLSTTKITAKDHFEIVMITGPITEIIHIIVISIIE